MKKFEFLFGILKVTEERNRIQKSKVWIRGSESRTKMSRIPNTALLVHFVFVRSLIIPCLQVQELVSPELFGKYEAILLETTLESMADIILCPRCNVPPPCDEKFTVTLSPKYFELVKASCFFGVE